jgi:hypothetical protein
MVGNAVVALYIGQQLRRVIQNYATVTVPVLISLQFKPLPTDIKVPLREKMPTVL